MTKQIRSSKIKYPTRRMTILRGLGFILTNKTYYYGHLCGHTYE